MAGTSQHSSAVTGQTADQTGDTPSRPWHTARDTAHPLSLTRHVTDSEAAHGIRDLFLCETLDGGAAFIAAWDGRPPRFERLEPVQAEALMGRMVQDGVECDAHVHDDFGRSDPCHVRRPDRTADRLSGPVRMEAAQ